MTAQDKNSQTAHTSDKRSADFYIDIAKHIAYIPDEDRRDTLLEWGLDEEAADALLAIKDTYHHAIQTAESDYREAVVSPDDMDGIYNAHIKRNHAYDDAAWRMWDSLCALAQDTERQQPMEEDTNVEERIQRILDRDGQEDRYAKANEIIALLYGVDIQDAVQSQEERRKLYRAGFGTLGIVADTALTDLLNRSQIEPGTAYLLKRKLGKYHIRLLDRREEEALPEVERLRRQNRALQHMYREAQAEIWRHEEESEGPDCEAQACDGQDAGQKSLEEARAIVDAGGIAALLCCMKYEDSSCSLCRILQLTEHGCLQAYATCRHCVDAYLARHYGVEEDDIPYGFPPRYVPEDALNDPNMEE